jgi:hypothetical protein
MGLFQQAQRRIGINPERKGQIAQHPHQRKEGYEDNPKQPLPFAKGLAVDACQGANKHSQPNNAQAEQDLIVEFHGIRTESA